MATTRSEVDRSVFAAHAANVPFRAHALWFLSQMARWGYVDRHIDAQRVAETVYRPDMLKALTDVSGMRGQERFFDSPPFVP